MKTFVLGTLHLDESWLCSVFLFFVEKWNTTGATPAKCDCSALYKLNTLQLQDKCLYWVPIIHTQCDCSALYTLTTRTCPIHTQYTHYTHWIQAFVSVPYTHVIAAPYTHLLHALALYTLTTRTCRSSRLSPHFKHTHTHTYMERIQNIQANSTHTHTYTHRERRFGKIKQICRCQKIQQIQKKIEKRQSQSCSGPQVWSKETRACVETVNDVYIDRPVNETCKRDL